MSIFKKTPNREQRIARHNQAKYAEACETHNATIAAIRGFLDRLDAAVKTGDQDALAALVVGAEARIFQANVGPRGFGQAITDLRHVVGYGRAEVAKEEAEEAARLAAEETAKEAAVAAKAARKSEWERGRALDAEFGAE